MISFSGNIPFACDCLIKMLSDILYVHLTFRKYIPNAVREIQFYPIVLNTRVANIYDAPLECNRTAWLSGYRDDVRKWGFHSLLAKRARSPSIYLLCQFFVISFIFISLFTHELEELEKKSLSTLLELNSTVIFRSQTIIVLNHECSYLSCRIRNSYFFFQRKYQNYLKCRWKDKIIITLLKWKRYEIKTNLTETSFPKNEARYQQ